jgi:hypothetical protein
MLPKARKTDLAGGESIEQASYAGLQTWRDGLSGVLEKEVFEAARCLCCRMSQKTDREILVNRRKAAAILSLAPGAFARAKRSAIRLAGSRMTQRAECLLS